MNQDEAIKVLIQVAELAQNKGCLTLKDAVIVAKAIECFSVKQEEPFIPNNEDQVDVQV